MNQTTSHCKIYLEIADVNFRLNTFSLNAVLAFIHLAMSCSLDNATDMELVACVAGYKAQSAAAVVCRLDQMIDMI